ncbi:MAG: CvpA family protein [Treponema sp.]|jgi:membrane protein required for colicin V production|nr:CvpA family protein [Treponema sp.]
MVIIDIVFILLILLFAVRGALKGFIEEVTAMASVVLALGAAFFFHRKGAEFLIEKYFPGGKVLPGILAFLGLFVIVFVAVKLLGFLLRDISSRISLLDTGDHLLGFLFGILEGVVLVSLLLWIMTIQPFLDAAPVLEHSIFAEILLPFIGSLGKVSLSDLSPQGASAYV